MEVFLSQWLEWKRHPVTKELLKALADYRSGKVESIAHGGALELESLYLEIGRAQGLEDAIHYLVEDVRQDIIDDTEVENV
jgi:hypothetical protein